MYTILLFTIVNQLGICQLIKDGVLNNAEELFMRELNAHLTMQGKILFPCNGASMICIGEVIMQLIEDAGAGLLKETGLSFLSQFSQKVGMLTDYSHEPFVVCTSRVDVLVLVLGRYGYAL